MSNQESGLAFIEVDETSPLKLFKKWQHEIPDSEISTFRLSIACLATATRGGKVSSRNIFVKEVNENGFVFVTSREGRKAKDIDENPFVAATFLWDYRRNGSHLFKQVRAEGSIREVSRQKCQVMYDKEKFHCKVRMHLCRQSEEVDWEALRRQHDVLMQEALNGKNILPMPDYYVGYQIVPEKMDFYYGFDNHVADRVVFTKSNEEWKYAHVAA